MWFMVDPLRGIRNTYAFTFKNCKRRSIALEYVRILSCICNFRGKTLILKKNKGKLSFVVYVFENKMAQNVSKYKNISNQNIISKHCKKKNYKKIETSSERALSTTQYSLECYNIKHSPFYQQNSCVKLAAISFLAKYEQNFQILVQRPLEKEEMPTIIDPI